MSRLTLALTVLVLAGCYDSHGRPGAPPPVPHPYIGPDGGPIYAYDAWAPPVWDAAAACVLGERHIRVQVEPRGSDLCTDTHLDSARVLGVDPEPTLNGIRIHTDFGGLDPVVRPCDIVVSNVGPDIASQIDMGTDVTIDWGLSFVSINRSTVCDCDGCGCDIALVFYAADADPTNPPAAPFEIGLGLGPVACPPLGTCQPGSWLLHADALGRASQDVPEGSDRLVGPFTVRSVRNVDIFGPCAACANCGSFSASWVVWTASAPQMCIPENGYCTTVGGAPCCPGFACCGIEAGHGNCFPEGSLCFEASSMQGIVDLDRVLA